MLFTSSFSDNEIVDYINETAAYIKAQREQFAPLAQPLTPEERAAFKPFFTEAILNTTLFYLKTDGPVESPAFISELNDRGVPFTLERLKAITFMDVVVAYEKVPAQVQFHELVHAVQYQKLGLKQFANKYLRGLLVKGTYERIPLEANARLLDEAFFKNPSQVFSVEQDVQRWINENKF